MGNTPRNATRAFRVDSQKHPDFSIVISILRRVEGFVTPTCKESSSMFLGCQPVGGVSNPPYQGECGISTPTCNTQHLAVDELLTISMFRCANQNQR